LKNSNPDGQGRALQRHRSVGGHQEFWIRGGWFYATIGRCCSRCWRCL